MTRLLTKLESHQANTHHQSRRAGERVLKTVESEARHGFFLEETDNCNGTSSAANGGIEQPEVIGRR